MYERLHRESGDLIAGRVSKYGQVSYPDGSTEAHDGTVERSEIRVWLMDYNGPAPREPPSDRTTARLSRYMSDAAEKRWEAQWGPDGSRRKEYEIWEAKRRETEALESAVYLPKLSRQLKWLRSMI